MHYGAERLGCTVVPISGGQTERQVQLIQDFKATMIVGTPSYVLNIVDEMERMGIDPRSTTPQARHVRRRAVGRSDARAKCRAGWASTPWTSTACPRSWGRAWPPSASSRKDGPVIWEDHFYPEIIDPETGAVLPDGSPGELVFTSLTKEALPIVRYRTRDLTRLLPPTARSFRRIGKITGRSDDMLIIRGVNVFPSQIEEQILKMPKLSPHYHARSLAPRPHGRTRRAGGNQARDAISEADKEAAAPGTAAPHQGPDRHQHPRRRQPNIGSIERSHRQGEARRRQAAEGLP